MSTRSLTCEERDLLCQAFGAEAPDQAWRDGLVALRALGVEPHARESGAPWLTLVRGASEQSLSARHPFDEASKGFVEQLVGIALARVDEHAQHGQTRERLRMLSEASFEGIMVHVDGHVIESNLRLAEILACEPHEALGTWPLRHCVAPEDMPAVLQRMQTGYEGAYVITGVRKDGTRFRAELQSKQGRLGDRPVRIAAVRDVTEREHTLRMLRESETRLRDLATAAFDLTVLSRNGVVVDVGGPIEAILGYAADSVVGRPLLDFVAPSSIPLASEVVAEGRTGAYQATLVDARGNPVPVEILAVNSTFDGQPTRVAGVRDLRESKRMEAERQKLERQVARAQRLDSLGVLTGGIAHDFNNLLVGILGNADLLLGETRDPETRETLEAIIGAGKRAASLTAQMLAYAGRGEAGQLGPVDLGATLAELAVLLSATLSKKAVLSVDVPAECRVLANRTTLTQVLMNLLTNASDALEGQAGTIAVRVKKERQPDGRWDDALGATVGPGDWVLIEVEDSGKGMDEATAARIFEPFFTTKVGGHGLGLAACLGIVSALGGAVRVDSQPGRGSCFSLLLPATLEPMAVRVHDDFAAPEACTVLVMDDEAVVRMQMRRTLELRGFTVLEAVDGREGLALLEREPLDVLIVDMSMPELDGADVVRALRARGARVPVVLTSGYVNAAVERRLAQGSFQAFLRKPYVVGELLEAIGRARRSTVSATGTAQDQEDG